jgi:small subunit ribosomal protein S6
VNTYETLFITLPTLTEDEEKAAVGALVQVVHDGGGSLAAADRMGRRRLAYPIRKFEDGVYTRLLYDADPAVPKELDRRIRLSDRVLRHLTVRLDEGWAAAAKEQAVRDAQARAEAEAARAAEAEAGEAIEDAGSRQAAPASTADDSGKVAGNEDAEADGEPGERG